MAELKEYKLEMKILSVRKPSEKEMYEAIRKHFHVRRSTYDWFSIERDWLTVRQVKSALDLLFK